MGEAEAARFLEEKGYRILERNYRCPLGEVDVVALEGDTLVFIEVKSRTSLALGYPQEGVTEGKQRKLTRLAHYYLKEKGLKDLQCRFDVAAVLVDTKNPGASRVELITDAF